MELAKLLGLAVNDVVELASFIARNLNPYPARAHWGEQPKSSQDKQRYGVPDIIISHLNNSIDAPLVVEIFSPYSGIIRVNPLFKEAISQVPTEKSEEWQSALDQATLLVKCIQQRNHTLVRLMTMLTNIQKEFILYGNSFMKPITRANLAEELEVHESTVSRAVSAKSVQLPNGRIIPLSKLFDRSLNVRTAMKQIIVEEAHPLSDTEIADRLSGQGFPIARRTVAKYRAMEGILPSRMRLPAQIDAHGSA
jgi:RNA polymerase sigma-54 factor